MDRKELSDICLPANGLDSVSEGRIIHFLANVFSVLPSDIDDLQPIKQGLTNESFTFSIRGKGDYVLRVPNENTSLLVNRKEEAEVYNKIKNLAISDSIFYLDYRTGIKITRFISNAHTLNIHNKEELELSLNKLKELHNSGIAVNHIFDLRKQILAYEKLRIHKSKFPAYDMTRNHIMSLLDALDLVPKQYVLCHIDANCDNFLISDEKKVFLIDFEYAGMQDLKLDLAMICIYSDLDKIEIDQLIALYYGQPISRDVRYMIYAYIAIAGFLWSIWCEIKEGESVLNNKYACSQYRYAVEYFNIVQGYANN